MKTNLVRALCAFSLFAITAVGGLAGPAAAATTGSISGIATGASGAPLSGVTVTATAPSASRSATTDARGFYAIVLLDPDTYTVTFSKAGYDAAALYGVLVIQDQVTSLNKRLAEATKTLGTVAVNASASSLVQKNQGADVYVIGGRQLAAATGGDDLHKTLYEYMQALPGVTANGYPGQPRVRGGQVTDLSYEFDGIPIQDRITGFFTTNLSNVGVSSVELFTGGYGAEYGNAGTGVLNSVVKVGTYPHNGRAAFGFTGRDYNHYLTLEYGTASPDHRYSAYVAFDGVNSLNTYNGGDVTYPNVLYGFFNGAGPVYTRDIVGNFHLRPDAKDDFQLLVQNGFGLFDFNYLLGGGTPNAPLLQLLPCAGAAGNPNTISGASGGVTSRTNQPCPLGLQFVPLDNNNGNKWNHYSGLGKLQWNHTVNEHSFLTFRLAENYNSYIFDQPLTDPNYANLETAAAGCPAYPYAAYSPLQASNGDVINGSECTADIEDFYGDRSSHMYVGNLDYDNQVSDKVRYKIGVSNERDDNIFRYYLRNLWGSNGVYGSGGWPYNYLKNTVPTSLVGAYVQADVHVGKLLLQPGVRYDRELYGIPGNPVSEGGFSPRFAGTYSFDNANVVRFSFGTTNSLIGSGYVFRENSGRYNPSTPGFSAQPQLNHSADMTFEHQFPDGVTAFKVGPWYHKTDNYYSLYQPIVGQSATGGLKLGAPVLSNAGHDNAFGAEFALSHDIRQDGLSYWITGTYDNYWTTSTGQAAFVNFPIDTRLVQKGFRVRFGDNPLFSGTIAADFRSHGFEVLPFAYYQTKTFYNLYNTCVPAPTNGNCLYEVNGVVDPNPLSASKAPAGAIFETQPQYVAGAWWRTNLTIKKHLGDPMDTTLGVRATNLTNQTDFTTPCMNSSSGTGCYPFNGPQSGFTGPPRSYVTQFETQSPRRFEFFVTRQL
ncbi:MAG: TonB-dependent receptor [Candidatus Eremiobacteraeota bacterium]|nr:TonB-dependent receptor [Candidatus Eremiobacteraeota bacterium]